MSNLKYIKNYTNEIQEIISNTKLTKEQTLQLNKCMFKLLETQKSDGVVEVFGDMYKLYVSNISTADIAEAYNKNIRTIQLIFKKLGLARDLKKAQSIAVKKRDYVQIRESFKQTMLDRRINSEIYGSEIEQYVRQRLSLILNSKFKEINGEAIIGVNTITPAGELDIPIIILINNKTYKYGVEVDGSGFHRNRSDNWRNINDIEKEEQLTKLGYKILRIETKAYMMKQECKIRYENELKKKINNVVEEILKDFN